MHPFTIPQMFFKCTYGYFWHVSRHYANRLLSAGVLNLIKMKVILIDTPKGQFHLPLQKVAEHRADYYACEVDGHEKNSPEWQEEVDWVMKDNFEGIDWLINDTNWDEWESSATKVNDKVNVTDDEFWCSSDGFEIVEA